MAARLLLLSTCCCWGLLVTAKRPAALNAAIKTSNSPKLELVHVIYRHGDRAPSKTFPTGTHNESAWPRGWNQLTKKGMEQQRELGEWLRKRYKGFLSPNYNRKEIFVRSTDKDRTIESALCNLAGLCPADKAEVFRKRLQWQPIPVRTLPLNQDKLLSVEQSECRKQFEDIFEKQSGAEVERLNKKHSALFRFLEIHTGLDKVDFLSIKKVYSPLFRERQHSLRRPKWLNDTIYNDICNLQDMLKEIAVNTPEKARLRGGMLLGDIVQRLEAKASGKMKDVKLNNKGNPMEDRTHSLKVQMYSAHAETVTALMGALELLNGRIAPYAACFIVELYHDSEKQHHFVRLFYRNETKQEKPHEFYHPRCPSPCTLEKLREAVAPTVLYSLSEWRAACKLKQLPDACFPSENSNAEE